MPAWTPASPSASRGAFAAAARTRGGLVGIALLAFIVIAALFAPVLGTSDPSAMTGPALHPPSRAHLLGTDPLGRDLYSAVLYGARTSLLIAAAASLIAFGCGLSLGLLAGHAGRAWDDALMRGTELVQVVPRFLLIIVAVALFGAGTGVLVVAIGLTSWPTLARAVRTEVISLRAMDFVRAAEAIGASPLRVIRRELLPNVLPTALTLFGLSFGQVLLLEASLGFLGAADPNALSWGMLAGQAQGYLRVAWWLPLFPGLAIVTTVLGVNLMVDAFAAPPWPRPHTR